MFYNAFYNVRILLVIKDYSTDRRFNNKYILNSQNRKYVNRTSSVILACAIAFVPYA